MRKRRILVELDNEIAEKLKNYTESEVRSITYVVESALVFFLGIESDARSKWLLPVNSKKRETT